MDHKLKIHYVASQQAKILFSSDLMLGNRKYIDCYTVSDDLYETMYLMLHEFEKCEDEFDFEPWLGKFRSILFIIRDNYIDTGVYGIDPRVDEHDTRLLTFLTNVTEEYNNI